MIVLRHWLVAVFLLAVAVFALRAVLPAPARMFPFPQRLDRDIPKWRGIIEADQKLTAALVTRNARTWVTRPTRLMDGDQCYPTAHATTLGEHMLGIGLLGVVPYLLTGDPVLTYNAVLVFAFWIAALAMYALVYFWTHSTAAALVAALLFGFHPTRLMDLVHPYVLGNWWTPLALLFAHRLFTRGRWRDAIGLALFVGLQTLESIYPLIALAVLGGSYGLYLLLRDPRQTTKLVPKLLAVGAATGGLAAAVLGPYLVTRATWGTLTGRMTALNDLGDFAPGRAMYLGSVLVVLAAIGLADRARGARRNEGYDPRLVFAVAGLLVLWTAVKSISVPLAGLHLPSLFTLGGRLLPGFDAIRGGGAVRSGVYLVAAFLAGYGVLALVERRQPLARALIGATLAAAALAEVFVPRVAAWSFGGTVEMRAYPVRPPPALVKLYGKLVDGPVLDLPFRFQPGAFFNMATYVWLGVFHGHPVAACYNSFILPIQHEIATLADRVTRDPRAADALYALGIRNIVVHWMVPGQKLPGPRISDTVQPLLVMLGSASGRVLYGFASAPPVTRSFAALAPAPATSAVSEVTGLSATLALAFRNGAPAIYRHPDPLAPTAVVARWLDGAGVVAGEHALTTLLPLALAPGEEQSRLVTVPLPTRPGEYQLTLAPAGTPDLVIARAAVLVHAGTDGSRQ